MNSFLQITRSGYASTCHKDRRHGEFLADRKVTDMAESHSYGIDPCPVSPSQPTIRVKIDG
jgi:hypothetical protein